MATLLKGTFRINWQPTFQSVRFKNKVNIQRPRPPHWERAKVVHVCKPEVPDHLKIKKTKKEMLEWDWVCGNTKEKPEVNIEKENPYAFLLAKDFLNKLNHSRLIAFFHANAMEDYEILDSRVAFNKFGIRLFTCDKEVVNLAIKGTVYEPVNLFFESETMVALCEDAKVVQLMKCLPKAPKISFMAAIVDGRLLSKREVEYYAKLPDLQIMRSNLVNTLNRASLSLVQNLNYHPTTLVSHLKRHVELSQKADSSSSDSSSSSSSDSDDDKKT